MIDDSDAILSFEVEDTGIGIKSEDMARLFTEFERIEIDRNRNIEGTGLGMPIAVKLLSLMGSELRVKSEYGKGSVFGFDLRQRIVEEIPIGNYENRIRASADPMSAYSDSLIAPDAQILIVDDNKMNFKVFTALLKKTQIQITEADSGYRAIELATSQKFDVIFMDHMMPGMDGVAINVELCGGALYTKNYKASYNTVYSYLLSALEKSKDEDNYGLVVFDDESHENNYKMLELLEAIKGSVRKECEGFYLCYQPFVSTVTGKIIGAEALLRWRSPEYGEVSPGRFVPHLESHSCFYDLSIWVLRRAMLDAKEIIKENPGFFINVNISYKQLERPEFTQEVLNLIKELEFPAKNLQLEITERCRNLDMLFLKQQLLVLRRHGINIALDDYGTGNSTINFLCELPLTSVKIDQTFILNILNKGSNQVVVDSTVQCAKRLGLNVCLEGIETQEIKEYIEKYPANYHQGYFYSRPVEFAKFKSFIHETWQVGGVSLIKGNPNDSFGVGNILSMIPGGFFIYADNESEKILSVNEMLLDIFECGTVEEFSELTKGSFSGMVHPEDYLAVKQSIEAQIRESVSHMDFVKYRIVTKKGDVKYVRDYGRLVHNDNDVDLFYVFLVEEQNNYRY